jgi:hypothetical protein
MTYLELIKFLQDRHFYPSKEITISKKGETITALQIQCDPIFQKEKLTRLNEVLHGTGYLGQRLNNKDYLVITKIK